MNPVPQIDIAGPMMAMCSALVPYVLLAIPVGVGAKTGMAIAGDALTRDRPASHGSIGLALVALNVLFGWVLYAAYLLRSAEFMGQTSYDRTVQRLSDTPSVVMELAAASPGALFGVLLGGLILCFSAVGRRSRRTRAL